ncbi:MAG TPA: type II toxin-antitoxin system HipA family toxin [Dehalococcoidia bacterium]|nr:type II toxin-antitoxin system HipA family toxin [Dehalococcoidia bacterium]
MADQLVIWLYGVQVAVITRHRGRLRLEYTEDAFNRYELGTPVLSLSLPLRIERYTHIPVQAFIDGLLPEGQPREIIARDFGIKKDDTYRLIEALGRDCAGAIVIQPADANAPPLSTTLTARHLTDPELADLVTNLRNAPLGAGGQVRISLAGVQEKLLLTRMLDGSWGQPVDGTPSTHILKPEIRQYPSTVENEAFGMRLAKKLGLAVAQVETTVVAGRKLIVVERYDRLVHPDGSVERLHQEDFCQATAVLPAQKYQEDGGPSLKRLAGILQSMGPLESMEALLRAVTLNVLLGNGDAHAKNFSLIHEPTGLIHLAPLYDIMSTLYYDIDDLAMYIDNVHRIRRVTTERIVNEAVSWGMNRRRALEIVMALIDKAAESLPAAQAEIPDLPSEIPAIVQSQIESLSHT